MKQNLFSRVHVFVCLIFVPHAIIAQTASSAAFSDTALAYQYFAQAEQFAEQTQYDSSNFYFEKSRLLYASLASSNNHLKSWEKVIICWNKIGKNYRNQARHLEALEIFNKAVETGRQKLDANHPAVAASYDGIGQIYDHQLELEEARRYYEKALAMRLQRFGEDHPDIASSYVLLGNVYDNLGAREKGSAYLQKALNIRLKLLGENHLDVADSYHALANLNWKDGDYDEALAYFEKSRRIRTRLLGENHPKLAKSYGMIAMIYYCMGQYQTALAYCQRELQLHLLLGENNPGLAPALVNIAAVYSELGEYDQALACLYKSTPLFKKNFGEAHQAIATKHQYIGEVYLAKGDYATALRFLNESLDMQLRFPNTIPVQVATLCYSLGELHAKQHQWERALNYYQKSILYLVPGFSDSSIYHNPPLRRTLSEVDLLKALAAKARSFAARYRQQSHSFKDLEMALSTYQAASDLIQLMRNNYKENGSKLFLAQKAVKIYEESIATALQAHTLSHTEQYLAQAFYFAEKSKASLLMQSLQEVRAKQFAGIPPRLLEKEKSLRLDLANCETELQKEKEKRGQQNRRTIGQLEDRYFVLQRDYQNLINHFEKSYPKYYELKYNTQTATADKLQKALDENTAVLEYFIGDSVIFAFVATKDGFDWAVAQKDAAFTAALASLSSSFKNVSSKSTYLQNATQVYRILVKPFETPLSDKRRWVIIPDGDLHLIPFEALLTDSVAASSSADYRLLPYLLKQREISYHYSATLFLKSLVEPGRASYANLFAGFAPVFDAAAKNGLIYRNDSEDSSAISLAPKADSTFLATRDGKTLDPLLHSAQEVQNIAAAFPGHSRTFIKQEASEENFKQQIKGYKYVHIATHGRIVEANPKLSNLTFSQPQAQSAQEDGILFSAETYNLDLNADLLVLSACQTGAGQIIKGEGLMALTRGFLYSGAQNLIASLWKVYDQHTSLLMVEMYRQIAADKSYSAALREAKLKMIANPETAAPQSWASFVLIGK